MTRDGERGFTLLELLLTLTVTTIGLIGLMALHLSIARGNDLSNRTAEGSSLANATLEGLRAARVDQMVCQVAGCATPLPIDVTLAPDIVGRAGQTFRRRVTIDALPNASTALWLVRVEVSWTEDGAAAGANGGLLDHRVSVEVVRTFEEAL